MFCKIIFSTLLISCAVLNSVAQQSVAASGGDASGGGGSAGYTVGQTVYVPVQGTNNSITPGMQQPFEIAVQSAISPAGDYRVDVVAYPNPTIQELKLIIGSQDLSEFSYQLFDMRGNLINESRIKSPTSTVNFGSLPAASYLLRVNHKNLEIKSFTIIKN